MASAGILGKALERAGKKPTFKAVKQLYSETFDEIRGLGSFYLFADFGSSYLPELRKAFGEEFLVIDHHQPKSQEKENHLNSLLYGIDGGTEISGSGLSYLLARELGENKDLAALAIVGAVGDMQDYSGKLKGLNREILEDGISAGVLSAHEDFRLYGRISRPLVQYIVFSSNPILPELTASEENCIAFLADLGISLKTGSRWRSYIDLSENEKKKLATALVLHLQSTARPNGK